MTSVSTHILDTSAGRPAAAVAVTLSVRTGFDAPWTPHAASVTDADGRCSGLPELPATAVHVRLDFAVEPYFEQNLQQNRAEGRPDAPRTGDTGAFFPEVTVVFAVAPGEHHHVPLLLSPFGYSVYRGS